MGQTCRGGSRCANFRRAEAFGFSSDKEEHVKFRRSQATQRLVGRLDEGDELVSTLTKLCDDRGVKAGEVRCVGHFDAIELVHFNAQSGEYEEMIDAEGSFDLVSLTGNISRLGGEAALRLGAVFSVATAAGTQMVGGQLRKARAVDGEFVIDIFSDLEMTRRLDGKSGRLILDGIERVKSEESSPSKADVAPRERRSPAKARQDLASGAAAPSSTGSTSTQTKAGSSGTEQTDMSWDEALAEVSDGDKKSKGRAARKGSKRAGGLSKKQKGDPYADFDFEEPLMERGDYLDHIKLGRCRVLDVEEDQYIRIRLPRGRIRKLALGVLEIEYKGEEDGRSVFDARVSR